MYFSRLLFALTFLIASISHANEIKSVITYGAGSQTDLIARQMQISMPQSKLIIENLPGADTIVGTMHWLNNKDREIVFTSSTQLVFNPILKKDTIQYSTKDFKNIIHIGTSPGVWITRPDTNINTSKDLITKMPPLVGYHAASYITNLTVLNKEKSVKSEGVPHKTVNDVVINIINKSLDMGMVPFTSMLLEQAKIGKIKIIGSSYHEDITIDNIFIPSVSKSIGIPQFSGFIGIAVRTDADSKRVESLQNELWNAIQHPDTQARLKQLFVLQDSSKNIKEIERDYEKYRKAVDQYLKTN